MEQYIIKGGNPLVGEVEIGGAKNAALAIIAAAIMTDETVEIDNLPDVKDVNVLLKAIQEIGGKVERLNRHSVRLNGSMIGSVVVENDYIKKIRASYYLLGALLGKYKRAEVALPGGCNICLLYTSSPPEPAFRPQPNHLARALYIPTDSRNPKVRRSQLPENHPDSVLCISQHLPAALHQVTCFLRLP